MSDDESPIYHGAPPFSYPHGRPSNPPIILRADPSQVPLVPQRPSNSLVIGF